MLNARERLICNQICRWPHLGELGTVTNGPLLSLDPLASLLLDILQAARFWAPYILGIIGVVRAVFMCFSGGLFPSEGENAWVCILACHRGMNPTAFLWAIPTDMLCMMVLILDLFDDSNRDPSTGKDGYEPAAGWSNRRSPIKFELYTSTRLNARSIYPRYGNEKGVHLWPGLSPSHLILFSSSLKTARKCYLNSCFPRCMSYGWFRYRVSPSGSLRVKLHHDGLERRATRYLLGEVIDDWLLQHAAYRITRFTYCHSVIGCSLRLISLTVFVLHGWVWWVLTDESTRVGGSQRQRPTDLCYHRRGVPSEMGLKS